MHEDPDAVAPIAQDAREAHRRNEQLMRAIFHGALDAIILVNHHVEIADANPAACALFERTREQLVGRPLSAFAGDPREVQAAWSELAKDGRLRRELTLLGVDGAPRCADFSVTAGVLPGLDLAILRDVTERRKMQEQLRELAALVESSEDAIEGTDLRGTVTSWNRGAERLFGYSTHEALGQHISFLLPEERRGEEHEILEHIAQNDGLPVTETTRQRKDGSLVEVSLSVWPIRNAAGQAIGSGRIARDLTARRKAEARLRGTEEQLRQAQKMEAIGSLAGGVAHDFNNLLSIMLAFGGLALDGLPPDSPARADLEQVNLAARRAASLTKQLLTFSRQQILEPQVVDINLRVSAMQTLLGRLLGEDVRLRVALSPELGLVYADPSQVDQVLMNLAVNARDAMPNGGTLLIETSNVLSDSVQAEPPELAPGAYVRLTVTDTGSGIAAATLPRIFEPFFTTKGPGKGTGLGLSTVFGIVKQSGGHVSVSSELGKGSLFGVYLPRTDRVARATTTSLPPPAPSTARGSETILVVEDDDALRSAVRAVLRNLGYRVLEAQNGVEALLVSEQYRPRIDLLLTDVVMPRMSGRELVAQLLPTRRELKVLYMSGYAENTVVMHGTLDAGLAYLAKPVTPEALSRKVREVLDSV